MNFLSNAQQEYEKLWKLIIRPTRSTYPESRLGPEVFQLEGKKVKRKDFQLINSRGYGLYASHFLPLDVQEYPCVIYMHGNSSNRTQGMEYLGNLIRHNVSLCTFDFSGCGNAEGDYVSLGYFEQQDLHEVVEWVRHKDEVTQIAIWGRSMGAVTGLLYLNKCESICAAVFDSPFKSLKSLVEDMCKKNSNIPSLVITGALKIISRTIEEKAKFSIYRLNPLKYQVTSLTCPAFFVVGSEDEMIPPDHCVTLYEAYKGENKKLQVVKGGHNDTRPDECVEKIIKYLLRNFKHSAKQIKQTNSHKKEVKGQSAYKQQQIDFFDDQQQDDIANSSEGNTENVDFFADDEQLDKTETNDVRSPEKSQGSISEDGSSFSLTSMISNAFGLGHKHIERADDGFRKTLQRISNEIHVETTNLKDAKRQKEFNQKIKAELQNSNKDIENLILQNLETWAF